MAEVYLVKSSSDECHWTLLIYKLILVQVMAWCCHATSHYLNQCSHCENHRSADHSRQNTRRTSVSVNVLRVLPQWWRYIMSIHRGLLINPTLNPGDIPSTHTHVYHIEYVRTVTYPNLDSPHTHQALLIPHIRAHLHIPSSCIHIFVELHVGSRWSVGTSWHRLVYPTLNK